MGAGKVPIRMAQPRLPLEWGRGESGKGEAGQAGGPGGLRGLPASVETGLGAQTVISALVFPIPREPGSGRGRAGAQLAGREGEWEAARATELLRS